MKNKHARGPDRRGLEELTDRYDARTSAEDWPTGGRPLRDTELLAWCGEVIRLVLADLPGAGS